MKKDDVLKKAREESSDEMKEFVQDKSMRWVFAAMGISLVIFTLVKQNMGQNTTDITVTLCVGASAGCFYRFSKLHDGKNLFGAITAAICAVVCLIFFIIHH